MQLALDPSSLDDYRTFLAIKSLPTYRIRGRMAEFPDEYAGRLGLSIESSESAHYGPLTGLFDYQRDITDLAIRRRKFAIFADCGLGKTLMLLEYARHCAAVLPAGQAVLLVSPLMVIPQTVDEAKRFYGDSLNIEVVSANQLGAWLANGKGRIGITNWEALRASLDRGRLGALIGDECFAPGTLVNTVSGLKRIETILPGDKILNASGIDRVIATKKREIRYAVKVTAGAEIIASPNHPFFTGRGWVGAQELRPGDSVLLAKEAMRMVQHGISSEGHARTGEILRSILLSEMAHEPAGICQTAADENGDRKTGTEKAGMVCGGIRESGARASADSIAEPHDESRRAGQGIADTSRFEAFARGARRKRNRTNRSSGNSLVGARQRMGTGSRGATRHKAQGVSDALQNRHCEQGTSTGNRSGWSGASSIDQAGGGQEEDRVACWARVDGVEVLERGHPELERFREADGKLYFHDLQAARHPSFAVNGLLVHNSSLMKSHYGKYGGELIRLGRGLEWKLAATGTPAPNDRIEYANHAVFLDAFPNVNAFLARFFVNRGQTSERWSLKPHALGPFYRAISHWCIFLTNPATYGWKDNTTPLPPIIVHQHDVDLTPEQHAAVGKESGELFAANFGGITSRSVLARIAKGKYRGEDVATNKPGCVKSLVDSWPHESTIIWCRYNDEQDGLWQLFPGAANVDGKTKPAKRVELIEDFKAGRRPTLISKPKILGFGLNLHRATRMVFSTCQDSYEEYYQCIKRANRYGSTKPLNVHLPVTELERPMMENVLRKANRVAADTEEQERIFKEFGLCF